MSGTASLTWVHVSDLHFGHGDAQHRFDQVGVTQAILRDAEAMCQKLGAAELLVVTGDISFSGQPAQFAQAREWLLSLRKAVGERARILVVPGNHDIDRKQAARLVHLGLRSEPHELDELLVEPSRMQEIWPKLESYGRFAGEFEGCAIDTGRPYWRMELPLPGSGKLWVCGLNTALLCFNDKDAPTNLRLGRGQLLKAVEEVPQDALLLVLQHHPPEWLLDGPDLGAYLAQRPHIQFCGHLHKQQGLLHASLSGSALLQFHAGAGHAERNEAGVHAYSWGRLDFEGLRYHPRVFIPERKAFAPAAMLGSDDFACGDHAFIERGRLPKKLATWLAPQAQAPRGEAMSPALRDSMLGCQQFFINNNERMVLAHDYKKVHDNLQDIEKYLNQCLDLIRLFQDNISSELRFLMITNQLADMRTRILSVIEHMGAAKLAAQFRGAVGELGAVAAAIDRLRSERKISAPGEAFVERLSSVLAVYLPRANRKIVEIVRELNFKDIRQQLAQLRAQLPAVTGASPLGDLLREAALFESTSDSVEHLSEEHSEWQIIDDWLRPIMNANDTMCQRAMFRQGVWATHQVSIQTRCQRSTELWARELLLAQAALVGQLADTQDNSFLNALNEYYSKTTGQFCEVDKALLSASEALFHSGQRIHMLIKGIAP